MQDTYSGTEEGKFPWNGAIFKNLKKVWESEEYLI